MGVHFFLFVRPVEFLSLLPHLIEGSFSSSLFLRLPPLCVSVPFLPGVGSSAAKPPDGWMGHSTSLLPSSIPCCFFGSVLAAKDLDHILGSSSTDDNPKKQSRVKQKQKKKTEKNPPYSCK
jgi:hypothetical protein